MVGALVSIPVLVADFSMFFAKSNTTSLIFFFVPSSFHNVYRENSRNHKRMKNPRYEQVKSYENPSRRDIFHCSKSFVGINASSILEALYQHTRMQQTRFSAVLEREVWQYRSIMIIVGSLIFRVEKCRLARNVFHRFFILSFMSVHAFVKVVQYADGNRSRGSLRNRKDG